jgi:hypothetical protein
MNDKVFLKKARLASTRTYHPDKIRDLDAAQKRIAGNIFELANLAYLKLLSEQS